MPHKPVKINDDKDLKTIQDYFSRPPRPERDFDAEEKARKQEEARLAQEEEEEARVRGLYDAEMEAQAEAKRRAGAEGGKEKDILSGFSEKDFVAPIKEVRINNLGAGVLGGHCCIVFTYVAVAELLLDFY